MLAPCPWISHLVATMGGLHNFTQWSKAETFFSFIHTRKPFPAAAAADVNLPPPNKHPRKIPCYISLARTRSQELPYLQRSLRKWLLGKGGWEKYNWLTRLGFISLGCTHWYLKLVQGSVGREEGRVLLLCNFLAVFSRYIISLKPSFLMG